MIRGLVRATNPPRRRPRESSSDNTGGTTADIGPETTAGRTPPTKRAAAGPGERASVAPLPHACERQTASPQPAGGWRRGRHSMVAMQGVTDGPRPGRRETGPQRAPPGATPRPRPAWHGWRAWRVSPRAFRRIAGVAVWALILTIVSGAAVRLTGSGLGCPDWPNCTASDVVAPLQFHAWVEFGNRLINAAVTVAALGAFAAAWLRAPRRRDLTLLAGGLVVGLLAEVGLGRPGGPVAPRPGPGDDPLPARPGLPRSTPSCCHRRAAMPDEQATVPQGPAGQPVLPAAGPAAAGGHRGGGHARDRGHLDRAARRRSARPEVRLLSARRRPAPRHLGRDPARPDVGHSCGTWPGRASPPRSCAGRRSS